MFFFNIKYKNYDRLHRHQSLIYTNVFSFVSVDKFESYFLSSQSPVTAWVRKTKTADIGPRCNRKACGRLRMEWECSWEVFWSEITITMNCSSYVDFVFDFNISSKSPNEISSCIFWCIFVLIEKKNSFWWYFYPGKICSSSLYETWTGKYNHFKFW